MLRRIHPLPLALAALALASCAPPPAAEEETAETAQRSAAAPADEPIMADPPTTSAPAPASGEETMMCDAAKAQFAVGQTYSDALSEQARAAAGAKTARRLVPGQMVTMEFRGDRLNLDTDAAGKVTAVRCG